MASTVLTNRFKQYILNADIDMAAVTINMALYNGSSNGVNTDQYTVTAEVSGTGYVAKGKVMASVAISLDTSNNVAYVDWADVSWTSSTITATDALVFADSVTSPAADPTIGIFDFGGSRSSLSGTFLVTLPAATFSTALVRLA